jgi:hypothetical protein
MNTLYVYTEILTARFTYIINEICVRRLGASIVMVEEVAAIPQQSPCIWYANTIPTINAVHIKPAGLLHNNGLFLGQYHFLPNNIFDITQRDILSDAFFLLSRFEEYVPHNKDVYGNYLYTESVLYKHQLLQQPIIEIWVQTLQEALQQLFTNWVWYNSMFKKVLTVDVDIAYAYKGRTIWRNILATTKDILTANIKNIAARKNVLAGNMPDPFDTYHDIYTEAKHWQETILFFPVGSNSVKDRHIAITHPIMQSLFQRMPQHIMVGLHPTISSGHTQEGISNALQQLQQQYKQQPVVTSRQHYLKMQLPETYMHLNAAGLLHDYTMGYNHVNGFRAGTCKPFVWYNLLKDKAYNVTLHPLTVMDAVYIYNQQVTINHAINEAKALLAITQKYNGEFVMVFHNNHIYKQHSWYALWKAFIKNN